MPRVKALRILQELPVIKGFKPIWLRPHYRQSVMLQLEEYEAIRLVDYEGLIHEQAAQRMNVSRPTLTRIYDSARKKLAQAIVEGRSFLIEGGDIEIKGTHYLCETCQNKFVDHNQTDKQMHCPVCKSDKTISLSDCFIGGCKRCRRCR